MRFEGRYPKRSIERGEEGEEGEGGGEGGEGESKAEPSLMGEEKLKKQRDQNIWIMRVSWEGAPDQQI